jgi:HSP20 family protein
MSREDVNVELRDNELTITGERREEKEEEKKDYRRVERSYGRFYRSFQLPSAAAGENVEARLENGVLRIEVPKTEEQKARRIEIS